MMGTQINLISDHHQDHEDEGRPERHDHGLDSFVVDIETLSSHGATDHHTVNSRTTNNTFQRNLSRKVSSQQRGNSTTTSTVSLSIGGGGGPGGAGGGGGVLDDSSNKATDGLVGECTSENIKLTINNVGHPLVVVGGSGVVGTTENYKKAQQSVAIAAAAESGNSSRWGRRNLKQQRSNSSFPWVMMDPRRILFFFATLSSMGTIILIYFTLSMGKLNAASAAAGLDYNA